jgi:hypothetical protein
MLGEKQNLANVMSVVSDLAVDGLHDGVRLGTNRDGSREVRFRERFERIEKIFPAAFPHFDYLGAGNGWGLKFRVSVVKKSSQRERILPDMCFTRMAMELDSASRVRNRASSGHCAIARSANFL